MRHDTRVPQSNIMLFVVVVSLLIIIAFYSNVSLINFNR